MRSVKIVLVVDRAATLHTNNVLGVVRARSHVAALIKHKKRFNSTINARRSVCVNATVEIHRVAISRAATRSAYVNGPLRSNPMPSESHARLSSKPPRLRCSQCTSACVIQTLVTTVITEGVVCDPSPDVLSVRQQ